MADAVVDFLLEDLRQMLNRCTDLILEDMVSIEVLYEDLKFIKDFLRDSKEKFNESDELKILVTHIEEVASKALVDLDMFTIISLMYEDINISERFYHVFGRSQKVRDMILEVKAIKRQVLEIYDKKLYSITVPQEETIAGIISRVEELEDYDKFYDPVVQEVNMSATSSRSTMSRASKSIVEEETLVGFEDEAMAIMERLTEVQRQQLDVISIVGMAGLGKTTLARKLYNDPFIVYHFYIRGWIYVSKVYRKRDLLLGLLSSVVENKNDFFAMSDKKTFGEQNLGEELYKRLKGKKFLIVMDNIWNLFAWNDLRQYFPNDNNGSRILLTTQLKEVALDIKASKPPHCLRFLTKAESWDLFQQKVFLRNSCPPELRKIGMEIVERCSGLPLAIVVVAGFLAEEEKMQESWNQFADYLRWSTVGDTEDFMDILEMSYINLPSHLKPCFTYFGALQIHYEILVRRLICFWIAQGYIRPVGQQSLEDVAEGYLMDLIDRSLIIPTKKSSNGKIKACHIHDTLLDLCLRKALEFQQPIYQHGRVTSSSSSILYNYPIFHSHNVPYIIETSPIPHVHFLSLNTPVWNAHPNLLKSSIYKQLRVFDISHFTLKNFPVVLLQLIHLRYLALQIYSIDRLPPLISNLWNLETLILRKREEGKVTIPHIWKMQKLRHLRISAALEFEKLCCECYALNDLQTISTLSLSSLNKDVLEMTPNLRKLGLFRPLSDSESISFPNLANLVHLQTLKLVDWRLNSLSSSIPQMGMFPPNIQKLILLGGHVDWKETSTLGLLPNLEVLKLEYNAFKGKRWETSDGGFRRLKFLKLKDMDLEQWIASSNHFPFLQQLVLDGCRGLKELPSGLCNTPTLLLIELYRPRSSAVESVRKIEEERHSSGDDGLKILICNQDED